MFNLLKKLPNLHVHHWVFDDIVQGFPAIGGHCSDCGLVILYCGPAGGYRDRQMNPVRLVVKASTAHP